MGRFDVLSGNAFSSKATPPITHGTGERQRDKVDRNIRIRSNDRGSRVNTEYSIEKDDFPEIPKANKSTDDNKEIGGNQWVNAIKKREEDIDDLCSRLRSVSDNEITVNLYSISELEITAGHWPFSEQTADLTEHFTKC